MKNSKCSIVTFVFQKEKEEEILHIYTCVNIEHLWKGI